MRLQCSALVLIALGACGSLLLGCDDDAQVVQDTEQIQVEVPEPRGRGEGGSASMTEAGAAPQCVATGCPAVSALGSVVPGCCQANGSCGGLVMVNGGPLCAPPNVDNLVEGAGSTLMQLSEETVVEDPACSDRQIFGSRLPGCCDQTGVCGVSTAPVASGSPGAIPGLALPATCVSPAEAARLGAGMAVLGAASTQLCGAADGAADAGAQPEPSDAGASGGGS